MCDFERSSSARYDYTPCATSQVTTTGARQHLCVQHCVNLHKTWRARTNPQAKCCNHHCWHIPINWSLSTPRRSSLLLWGGSSGVGMVRVSKVSTTPFRMLGGDQGKRGGFISPISQHSKQTHTDKKKQNPLGVYACTCFVLTSAWAEVSTRKH